MRRAINGLSLIVEEEMKLDPFSPALFVFCNKKRDIIKILYWDRSGFALWHKRLEKEKFVWPRKAEGDVVPLKEEHLKWLLEGFDFLKLKPHEKLNYERVF